MKHLFTRHLSLDKLFLKGVGALYPLLKRAGVNMDQLGEIMRIKLLIDTRRPKGAYAINRHVQNNKSPSEWAANLSMLFIGLLLALVLIISKKPFVGQTLYFFIFMVFLALTLVSDFTSVLLDTRERYILPPRPIDDRTIVTSRILHICIYVLRLSLLLGLPAIVLAGFTDGVLAAPVVILQILTATLLVVFIVNAAYLFLMDTVSPQRFKDTVGYFQIAFSVLIFCAYYLLPKLVNVQTLLNINLLSYWWAYLLPPVWVAAISEVLLHFKEAGPGSLILAFIGLVIPIASLWIVVKVLAPGFNKKLAIISTSESNGNTGLKKGNPNKFSFVAKIAIIIAREPNQNAGFLITWKLAARSRDFKLKVWPSFVYVPVYFLFTMFNNKGGNLAEKWEGLRNTHSYIFLLYMASFVLLTILGHISMSEKYKSAWVYYAIPVEKPGAILTGMYKAIITLYFLPYYFFLGSCVLLVWGPSTINDMILSFLLCTAYGIVMALFMVKGLPFSQPLIIKQGVGKIFRSFLVLTIPLGLAFLHYFFLMKHETAVWIAMIPALFINWLMLYYYQRQTWLNLEFPDL